MSLTCECLTYSHISQWVLGWENCSKQQWKSLCQPWATCGDFQNALVRVVRLCPPPHNRWILSVRFVSSTQCMCCTPDGKLAAAVHWVCSWIDTLSSWGTMHVNTQWYQCAISIYGFILCTPPQSVLSLKYSKSPPAASWHCAAPCWTNPHFHF